MRKRISSEPLRGGGWEGSRPDPGPAAGHPLTRGQVLASEPRPVRPGQGEQGVELGGEERGRGGEEGRGGPGGAAAATSDNMYRDINSYQSQRLTWCWCLDRKRWWFWWWFRSREEERGDPRRFNSGKLLMTLFAAKSRRVKRLIGGGKLHFTCLVRSKLPWTRSGWFRKAKNKFFPSDAISKRTKICTMYRIPKFVLSNQKIEKRRRKIYSKS